MALLIEGSTTCGICGLLIENGASATLFPAFALNENDRCYPYSDGAFHSKCIQQQQNGDIALRELDNWKAQVGPGKRTCVVCGKQVITPDDYVFIEHMTSDEESPLRRYNYTHLHRHCVPAWVNFIEFTKLASEEIQSGAWGGKYLERLLRQLHLARTV
jgi:hypothetical protein